MMMVLLNIAILAFLVSTVFWLARVVAYRNRRGGVFLLGLLWVALGAATAAFVFINGMAHSNIEFHTDVVRYTLIGYIALSGGFMYLVRRLSAE